MPKTTKLKMRRVTIYIQSINANRVPAKNTNNTLYHILFVMIPALVYNAQMTESVLYG